MALPNFKDLHKLLEDLHKLLAERAPEAVIGAAAITVMIFLLTAATQFSSKEAQDVCVGIGGLFGLVGAFGFIVAILRAGSRRPPPSMESPDDSRASSPGGRSAPSRQKKRPTGAPEVRIDQAILGGTTTNPA